MFFYCNRLSRVLSALGGSELAGGRQGEQGRAQRFGNELAGGRQQIIAGHRGLALSSRAQRWLSS